VFIAPSICLQSSGNERKHHRVRFPFSSPV
jgi:hypothetical protein